MDKNGLTHNSSGWFHYWNIFLYKLCGKSVFTIIDNILLVCLQDKGKCTADCLFTLMPRQQYMKGCLIYNASYLELELKMEFKLELEMGLG